MDERRRSNWTQAHGRPTTLPENPSRQGLTGRSTRSSRCGIAPAARIVQLDERPRSNWTRTHGRNEGAPQNPSRKGLWEWSATRPRRRGGAPAARVRPNGRALEVHLDARHPGGRGRRRPARRRGGSPPGTSVPMCTGRPPGRPNGRTPEVQLDLGRAGGALGGQARSPDESRRRPGTAWVSVRAPPRPSWRGRAACGRGWASPRCRWASGGPRAGRPSRLRPASSCTGRRGASGRGAS